MILKTINANSDGNCHLLVDDNGKVLILDAGVNIKDIKKAVNFNVRDIVGCIVTHRHKDHSKSVDDLMKMGKQVFTPYKSKARRETDATRCGDFKIKTFALTDKDCTHFVHTDQNGEECPCYGFFIEHDAYPDWNLIYITDCMYCKWMFNGVHNLLIGTNFSVSRLSCENATKTIHQVSGHMSVDTACDFIGKIKPTGNVILTHLSLDSADRNECIDAVTKVVDCPVYVADKGMNINI